MKNRRYAFDKKLCMKNKFNLTNMIAPAGRFGLALAGVMLLATTASSSAAEEVLPPSSLPYGLSYQEWSAKWWQWTLEQSTNHIEAVGDPGICSGPASAVRFLGGVYVPVVGGITERTNHISINSGTPLFFSILSIWVDNSGCPFTTNTTDQLLAEAAQEWSGVTTISCSIDGVAVAGLTDPATTEYLVQSPAFSYTTATKDNVLAGYFGEPCVEGDTTIYPAVAEGAYLMLSPLKPGKHTIIIVGIVSQGGTPVVQEKITDVITVL